MDDHMLLVIMAVFVAVAAAAMLVQAFTLFGIYKATRGMQQNVERLAPKVEALMESSRVAIEDSRAEITTVTTRATEVLDSAKKQLLRVDELLSDAATRTRRQMDHAEVVLDDAMDRAQETIASVHTGIMKPIREINAVASGLRAALHYLMRGVRPSPDQVTVDEEMFI